MSDSLTLPLDSLKLEMISRDSDHDRALILYFDKVPTDTQLRVIHDLVRTATKPHASVRDLATALFDLGKVNVHKTPGVGTTEAFLRAHLPKQDQQP